jgi:uncharacterized membrane protein
MMGFGCNGIGWRGWGAWGGMNPFGHILGFVLWAAVLVLLTVVVIWVVRRLSRGSHTPAVVETPLGAARRRLAAGEITVGEYDEIVHRLGIEPTAAER